MSITAPILEVCVPSGIFCYRNFQKFENGEKARGTVAFAQGAKIAQAVAKYNETTAKTANSATKAFQELAKECKVIDYAGKAAKWATKNVNPLICASSVIKTATSDDKVGTGFSEAGGLAGMFAGEGMMKLHLDKVFNEKNVSKQSSCSSISIEKRMYTFKITFKLTYLFKLSFRIIISIIFAN